MGRATSTPEPDPSLEPARDGWTRATTGPWTEALDATLAATAAIASGGALRARGLAVARAARWLIRA